ncbi:hypothetical protein PR003_g14197 [Phytophthora rubi]|uniref:Uncharacterized protein n=1 Tax=Phytophthora rubi TaxID=129364 RepID=A0A6A4F3C0_9STRA|nr:hypothetical protein PR002_g13666 [Phytophthora rubi]KAE9021447.1 hypothetical protein PR001_g13378 [Phytophthora rubi]KAE9333100.1 hypothetical protein PR003_g14197 [Phytophthora rubi]
MAGAEGDERDAVLAFLLGSTLDLGAAAATRPDSAAAEDDPSHLEPVSDSDAELETDVTSADAASDSEAATSCDSEGDQQVATSEEEISDVEAGETEEEGGPVRAADEGKNVSEAEHEDDCAAATSAESDVGERQEEQKKAENQKTFGEQHTAAEVKANRTKPLRGSAGTRIDAAVPKVVVRKDMTVKKQLYLKQSGRGDSVPTLEELLVVGCVATVLVTYLIACVYSFFHPLVVPLPDYEELYSAYDISNVSVQIVNPLDNSQITPQGVWFEWKLANFPADALQQYGAEVFRYRVSLDDEVITSEVGFLALGGSKEEERGGISAVNSFNRTVRFPIPLRKFTHEDESPVEGKQFKLHLEVTVPIPGLIGELKTYEQEVYVWKPAAPSTEDGVQLTLTSPWEGAKFEQGQSIVLEYTAVNVDTLEVLMNDNIYVKKTHVNDGNLLLRGLGVGPHKFEIRAMDKQGEVAASRVLHVEIVEHLTSRQHEG